MTKSSDKFLPYGRQVIDDDDISAVVDTLRSDWLTSGPAVSRFEQALASKLNVRHVIACANGTAALHLAALSIGLGSGDVAVVPSVTFLATANAVRYTGADVIFSDVDPDTGLMRYEDLNEAVSRMGRNVKVVFPVHLNGQCVDLAGINKITGKHGIKIITDSCHALGSEYRIDETWQLAGDGKSELISAFSFHPVKTIAMGEGGAVTTNDDVLAEKISRLRNHGMTHDQKQFEMREQGIDTDGAVNPWYYEMQEPGYNYRASDIHCALGYSQLAKLDRFIQRRRELVSLYDKELAPLAPTIRLIKRLDYCKPAWHLYIVLIDFDAIGMSRAQVMKSLHERGIGTQVHYLPLYRQPYYYHRYGRMTLPGAEAYYKRALSLPLHAGMTDQDVERVVSELIRIFG